MPPDPALYTLREFLRRTIPLTGRLRYIHEQIMRAWKDPVEPPHRWPRIGPPVIAAVLANSLAGEEPEYGKPGVSRLGVSRVEPIIRSNRMDGF
jgi:hypothetical protein